MTPSKRHEFILYLYDELAKCETEEEAEALVKIIDQEESYLPHPPPKGTVLDDIMLKPWRRDDV